jgi:hypothetical protein
VSLLDLTLESKLRVAKGDADAAPQSAFEQKKAKLEAARKAKKGAKDGAVEEKPKEKPKAYDVTLKVTGVADTDVQVAQFMTRLNASRLLKDVNLVVSDVFDQDGVVMRRFQVEMTLNPNAEVREDSPENIPPSQTAAVELGEDAVGGAGGGGGGGKAGE